MFRTSARIAVVALLALTITACSSDDDNDDPGNTGANGNKPVEVSPGIIGTVEEPESVGGCRTSVRVTYAEGDGERETIEMTRPAAVGAADASTLVLYASDDELDLGALPGMPRNGDDDLLTIEIKPKAGKKKVRPLTQGARVQTGPKAKGDYEVSVALLTDDGDLASGADARSDLRLVELGEEGAGVCVRIRHSGAELTVGGTFFAPLTLAK